MELKNFNTKDIIRGNRTPDPDQDRIISSEPGRTPRLIKEEVVEFDPDFYGTGKEMAKLQDSGYERFDYGANRFDTMDL